jgi:hypothetical protein
MTSDRRLFLNKPAHRGRFVGSVLAVVLLAALLMSTNTTVASSQDNSDYHLEAFGDPLDFSNPEDHVLANDSMLYGMREATMSGGQLHLDLDGLGFFSALWGGYPTGIPHGREGGVHPIDTSRYNRLVIRMNAPEAMAAGIQWFSCIEANEACSGAIGFTTKGGWNTYDFDLTKNTGGNPWGGNIVGVRIGLSPGESAHVDVDWVRIVPNGVGNVEEISGAAPAPSAPTNRVDYATEAGDPWDWNSERDGSPVHLRSVSVGDGRYSACNISTSNKDGDPGVVMNLPGGKPIDANRFKTLTVEYSYEGSYSARTVPGGGTVARVFWFNARGRHPTKSIHLYPNEHVFTIRLDDPRVMFQGIEPGKGKATGAQWAGMVTGFRFDPNQDPGDRCWKLGRMWLTADEDASSAPSSTLPITTATTVPPSTTPPPAPTQISPAAPPAEPPAAVVLTASGRPAVPTSAAPKLAVIAAAPKAKKPVIKKKATKKTRTVRLTATAKTKPVKPKTTTTVLSVAAARTSS